MNKDREKSILEMIIINKKVTVRELASRLYASKPSIRRDLADLERRHLIKRIHGGAVLEESANNKIPFFIRELEQSDEKVIIAKKAAELVHDDFVIFLDASTSAYAIIPFLLTKKNLTVITNGVKALSLLGEYGINTISTGGKLIFSCMALVGEDAYPIIDSVTADIAFFSCRGLSRDGMLTDIAPDENRVRRKMILHSKKSYLLCTSDRINKTFFHNLCSADDITGIIRPDEGQITD